MEDEEDDLDNQAETGYTNVEQGIEDGGGGGGGGSGGKVPELVLGVGGNESDMYHGRMEVTLPPAHWETAFPFKRVFWNLPPADAPRDRHNRSRRDIYGPSAAEHTRRQLNDAEGALALDELKLARKSIAVVVKGGCPAPLANDFLDPRLPACFAQFFGSPQNRNRFFEPTPVQRQCWPAILDGADVLGIAPTGSGKTLTYLLPAIAHIQAQAPVKASAGPVALVLVPTRELAMQVRDTLTAL